MKETLETFRNGGVVKATGSTWRKPPVDIPSSLYGRRTSVGWRSRKGWHGGARQDKTPASTTRTAPSDMSEDDDTVVAASAPTTDTDYADDDGDEDFDDGLDDLVLDFDDQHWDAAAPLGIGDDGDSDADADEKLDCVVSLPADQVCDCVSVCVCVSNFWTGVHPVSARCSLVVLTSANQSITSCGSLFRRMRVGLLVVMP